MRYAALKKQKIPAIVVNHRTLHRRYEFRISIYIQRHSQSWKESHAGSKISVAPALSRGGYKRALASPANINKRRRGSDDASALTGVAYTRVHAYRKGRPKLAGGFYFSTTAGGKERACARLSARRRRRWWMTGSVWRSTINLFSGYTRAHAKAAAIAAVATTAASCADKRVLASAKSAGTRRWHRAVPTCDRASRESLSLSYTLAEKNHFPQHERPRRSWLAGIGMRLCSYATWWLIHVECKIFQFLNALLRLGEKENCDIYIIDIFKYDGK